MIEVSVTDQGIGIKSEDQDKLFKLFGFLDRTKQINTKGVGLGLHISKMIVE
jgi:signal transduction histidine kinase